VRFLRRVGHRLRSLFRSAQAEADLRREIDLHLDQLTKEYIAKGASERDARQAARRAFGSVEVTKEQCRDTRRTGFIEDVGKDLRYALRVLRKSPGFTLTAVGSLALGIGANTAIFCMLNVFLLRPLPFDHPERIVAMFERNVMGDEQQISVAPGNFLEWQSSSTRFEHISAYTMRMLTLSGDTAGFEPQRVMSCSCSGNLFSTLGVFPVVGRPFHPDEDRFGAPRTAVISYDLWQRQFAGGRDLVGKTIRLNDRPYEVVGVMPRNFTFPYRTIDVWIPLLTTLPPQLQMRHDLHFLQTIGRIRSDASLQEAAAEIDGISARYKQAHPSESTGKGASLTPLQESLVSGARTSLMVLLGAVCCVLLIACVNIANLMLTRAAARTREIGIRIAVGAGRGRIIRQLITESVLLGLAGGAAGAALAVWIAKFLVARAPGADALLSSGTPLLDTRVFLFAFLIALAAGVAVGLFPAIRSSMADVTTDLKEATRSATTGRAHGRFRRVLVAAEVALSLMLLVAAGLLFRSFARLYDVQTGVRIDHTLTLSTSVPNVRYPQPEQRAALFTQLGDRVRALPGVKSAGLTSCTPLTGSCNILFFYIDGRPFVPGRFLTALERSVDPAFFTAAGIPLLRGRTFDKQDGVGFDAQRPRLGKIVISESMAKNFFAGEDPIGKRIFFDFEIQRERNDGSPAPHYEVVGVVGDVIPVIDGRVTPTLYRPLLDVTYNNVSIVAQTAVDPQSIVNEVRNEVRKQDPGLVVYDVRTMEDVVGLSTSDRRFTMLLFAAFAGLALLLASVGLYGVVSCAVSQRTAEIGIRMALGATRADVSRLMVMQGLKPAVIGVVIGIVGAAFASQVLRTLLFGVTPGDPLTFSLVPVLLLAVSVLACYTPAIRAAHLDPTVALRAE